MKQGSLGFQFEHVKAWNFHRLLVFVLRVPLMFTSSYLGKSCAGSGLQKSGDCSVPVFWLKQIGTNSPVCCYTYHMRTVSASYSLREFCILGVDLNLRRRSKDWHNSTNSDSVSGIVIAIIPANWFSCHRWPAIVELAWLTIRGIVDESPLQDNANIRECIFKLISIDGLGARNLPIITLICCVSSFSLARLWSVYDISMVSSLLQACSELKTFFSRNHVS